MSNAIFESNLSHFRVINRNGNKAQAKCPAHDDKHASLTITEGKDKTLFYCHAGCRTDDVLAAAGLTYQDAIYEKQDCTVKKQPSHKNKVLEDAYDYHNINTGDYCFTRLRYQGKELRYGIRRNGKIEFGLNGKNRKELVAVFGDLASIKNAISAGETIYIPEGEKDARTLTAKNLTAFTYGSCDDWQPEFAELVRGGNVVVLADNDVPGKKVAEQIRNDISGIAASVKIVVPVPDVEHADVTDFFEAGRTVEDLERLVEQTETVVFEVVEKTPVPIQQIEFVRNAQGKIIDRIDNAVAALLGDPDFHDMLRFNLFTGKLEVQNTPWKRFTPDFSDYDANQIRLILATKYDLKSEKGIERAIDIVSHEDEYHPIRDKLNSLEWDGIERISELFPKYLGAERSDYVTEATKLFLLGAINRVFTPGCKFDSMVCLVDEHQGSGKSTMARLLALDDSWFSDDVRNLDDETTARKLQAKWIIEFSEMLATANTKTVEAVKSFLSRQTDVYRIPYERYARDFPRQCAFLGTTNNIDFLPMDRSGNRRFIPIRCNAEKAEVHPLENERNTREYILQAYAEAMVIYRSGNFKLMLPDEINRNLQLIQQEFTPEDTTAAIIQEWLDTTSEDFVCVSMIFNEALKRDGTPKAWESREISKILDSARGWERHQTGDHKKRFRIYGTQRAWRKMYPQRVQKSGYKDESKFVQDENLTRQAEFVFK